jgi:hypothetical protein
MPPSSLTAQAPSPLRAVHWVLLAALLAATVVVRLWGVDHSLPHLKERDSHMAFHTELLRAGYQPPDPHNNDNQYPLLIPGILALFPSSAAPLEERHSLDDHLHAAASTFRDSRTEMALLSVLAVALTFALARSFVSNGWALFAAALLSANLLTQYFAQQARPHAAATAFFLAAVLACMRLARKPTLWSYVLAALACTLAIGALHSGLATLTSLVVACVFAALYVVHEPAAKLYRRLLAAPLLVAAVVAVAFRAFYPYLFREREGTDFDRLVFNGTHLVWGDHRVGFIDFAGQGFGVVLRTLLFYDPALLVLLMLAIGLVATRKLPIYRPYERWSDFWVAFAFAGPYLLLIGLFARTFERFLIPLAPFLAVTAAWGLQEFASRFRAARFGAPLLASLALALSSFAVARLAWLRAAPDSMELAAQWISANLDSAADRVYCVPTLDLPLARSTESLFPSEKRPAGRHSRWAHYQAQLGADPVHGGIAATTWDIRYLAPRPDLGYPFAELERDPEGYLRALGTGYYVIDASRMPARPVFTELGGLLDKLGAERVARIGPNEHDGYQGWSMPFEDEQIEGWPNVLRRLLSARCVGPVVEIYRLK